LYNKVAVFTSGGGGLLRYLISREDPNTYKVTVVVSDRMCLAIELAQSKGIPTIIIKNKQLAAEYLSVFQVFDLDLGVLAGYISIVPAEACAALSGRLINSHPALLPKFGGRGFYGVNVHQHVIDSGESHTGCTVHFVSPKVDQGEVIEQLSLAVLVGESAWELGGRVHELEKELLHKTLVGWPKRR
jgi:phosphoribosylglycinamide formyltransferase-1